ncbi:MAG: glycine--tRNA ligase subunit beta, partial [Polyangiales bacterium]
MASHEPRDFLLEIGTEELPAAFVQTGLSQLPMHMQRALEAARIDHGPMQAMGTPRRLALHIEAMAATQREERELRTGPPVQIAFAPDGRPTAAAQGFARQCGVTVDALRRVTKGKGEVVAAEVLHAGGPVCDVLALLVPEVCAQLHFAKTMRWGSGESAFARPVQWLVVRFGDAGIDCSFAGVKAGEHSFGHRFLHPGPVEISAPHAYVDALARAHVVVHPETRGAQMKAALDQAAADLGGHYDDDFLLSECRDLVETPHVVPGTFDAAFLRLPPALVVAVMRDHQRYFALFDDAGALLPHYLNVTNTAKAPDRIARGNDRVLHARLADARFFVDEDRKVPLETRAAGLDAVVFHAKLGSIGDKAKRIAHLLPALAQAARLDLDPALQARAARLCKADLLSLAVGEFPELQGVMGADYARAGGEDEAVAQAIEQHYWPRFAKDKLPNAPLAALLAVADRLDTLVGCLGVGLKPTGSADPFALRRIA